MSILLKRFLPAFITVVLSVYRAEASPIVKPVDTTNTHILYVSHLFLPAGKSTLNEAGSSEFSLSITETSIIIDQYQFQVIGKQGTFDLETTSIFMNYSRRISDSFEFRVSVPFYRHWGGFLDRYIEGFHKLFPNGGLRNGGREYSTDDETVVMYQPSSGGPDITEPFYGLGDPSIYLKLVLLSSNPGVSCTVGVKPGFGNKAFINSGTTDAGVSFTADYTAGRFYLYGMSGCSYLFGEGGYDDGLGRIRDYIACAAAGAGVMFLDSFFFSVQLYIHNSLYKTGVTKIDYPTVLNTYSIRWMVSDTFRVQFCIDEDPITYAAADIAFSFKCEYSF